MVVDFGCMPRLRPTSERTDRHSLPTACGNGVHGCYATNVLPAIVAADARVSCAGRRAGDCSALACSRHTAKPTLFCIFHACRPRRISRLLLVLFFQRALASFFEPALPSRLQYRSAPSLLGAEPGVAVSMVGLSAGDSYVVIPSLHSRWPGSVDGRVLGCGGDGVLHV